MYVIIVYDISTERVNKACKYLRRYLNWIQNSVFEGEVTESQLKEIEHTIKNLIDKNTDSVIIYSTPAKERIQKHTIGITKNRHENVI